MFYELTDTSVEMTDTLGRKLGFHPVFVIEAPSKRAALKQWRETHGRDDSGLTVKRLSDTSDNDA